MTKTLYNHNIPKVNQFIGVEYYPSGIITSAPGKIGNPTGKGGGNIRGDIKGWSRASRRRMRYYLLKTGAPDGWVTVAGTFTVPGPVLPTDQYKRLWHIFQMRVNRAGFGMIWRVEIQQRGAFHWHCLFTCHSNATEPVRYTIDDGKPVCHPSTVPQIGRDWLLSLNSLGSFFYSPPIKTKKRNITKISSLAIWPGADSNSAHVEVSPPGRGAWLRYLQDHATKSKQSQIAENIGRHWGIVGKQRFKFVESFCSENMTDRQYFVFMRALQRLATPQLKARRNNCPFGRRLGSRIRRGSWGSAVWFSRPETIKRISDWAMQNYD